MSLSKNYDKTYSFPVVFENIPIQKKPKNEKIFLKTTISASGWDILFKKLKNRIVHIDLSQYPKGNIIKFSNTKSIIQEQFNNIDITEVNPSFFDLKFDQLESKNIPIKLNIEKNFPPNFYITRIKTVPDSILVTGEKMKLKNTSLIETELFKINDTDTIIKNISLQNNSSLNLETNTIEVLFSVEEFIEKGFIVPINIENKPENVDLIIYPQEIELKCLVPIKIYENISASDFYISADFNNIEVQNDNRLILNIKGKPESVKNIQLEKEKVEFIIYQ